MKKLIFTLSMLMLTIAAWATDYTGTLTVNGSVVSTSATASINGTAVTLNDVPDYGTITLSGAVGGNVAGAETNDVTVLTGAGTVDGKDATLVAAYKAKDITYSYNYQTTSGSKASKTTGTNTIATQAMFVSVVVNGGKTITFNANTTGYQILNGDFEDWPQGTGAKEPRYWHSFQSANGGLQGSAGTHLSSSTEKRPGATGSYCADVYSTVVNLWITKIPANGTVTSGRLNAGSATAADVANHAHSNVGTDTIDVNGDPYFMPMVGRPDKVHTWVKLTQAGSLKDSGSPYGKVKAVITDGSYYQDPANSGKVWNNVLCEAENATIAAGDWQELNIPFSYSNAGLDGKNIQITCATNTKPGNGSTAGDGKDHLYLDDISVVYLGSLSGISIKGTPLADFNASTKTYTLDVDDVNYTLSADEVVATKGEGAYAYVIKDVVKTDAGYTVTAAVASNDLASSTQIYTIYVNVPQPKYYLTGTFNGWNEGDEMVELVYNEETGKYEADQAMGENAEFKLKDGEGVWYGAQSDGNFVITQEMVTNGSPITIVGGDGNNMAIAVAGNWHFAYDAEHSQLVVTGEWVVPQPTFFLTGTFNGWNEGDGMTELVYNEETGKYEADQAMDENAEFKLKDGKGVWYGAESDGNFAITQQMVTNGSPITIVGGDGNNMAIAVAGNWHFAYDAEKTQLVVTGEWVEPQPKVYIIGEVNGNSWAPNAGVEMTYDETTKTYSSDVTVGSKGNYGYFCFSTKLTDNADDWDGLAPYRLMPAPRGEGEGNFEMTRDEYNTDIAIGSYEGAVRLPAGQYRLVVNGELNSMRVEATLYGISVDPVAEGVTVTVADKYDTVLSKAIEGETVYVKAVSADTGRAIVGIMVYDTDDNTVASQVFTHNASSVDWTFTMPAKDVVIKVETATVSSFAALNSTETAANQNYVVSDPVAIAPYTLEQDGTVACMVSDNQGNYAMLVMGDGIQAPQGGLSAGFVVTKIANGALMLVSGQENAEMEYNIEKFALNNDNFEPADWQVFKLIGYFQMENGQPKVSAFSGKTAAGISTSYFLNTEMCPDFDAANFTVGEKYEFVGVLGFVEEDETLPEPVRRVLKGHADTARPIYLIDGTATISTGIDSIVKNVDAKSVRYFNVQGVELSEPVRGVNIVVIEHTDGSTTTHKVLK